MAKANTLKKKEPVVEELPAAPTQSSRFGVAMKGVLGGDYLSQGTFTLLPYLLFIAFLAFTYISNNYLAENKIREINQLRKEVKELRYEYIHLKSTLTQLEKQSQISQKLQKKGIRENTEPLKKLIVPQKRK
ncbi:MAG: hypothetical protein K9G61_09770 [Bacteroidales bacterium]|jgi:cell division protein FtsL|nr:hypothetical protein [Bacteroidota bacterium]MCF8349085.1 hypothetical protein [Bacteroidales bacterium]